MALIGKIRENTVFVLIFIGLAILLFVLMDIVQSNSQGGGLGGNLKMGTVSGTDISREDFEATLNVVNNGGDPYQNRDNLWQFYVNEAMVKGEGDALGLGVSETELRDLEFGPNPSPVIRRNFGNPQTGQIDRETLTRVQGYIDNGNIEDGIRDRQLNVNFVPIWRYQRREIIAQRTQEKLNALVSKSMYAPSWLAQNRADEQVRSLSVAMVKVPFDELDNSSVSVGDEDIQNYLNENRSLYTSTEETRVISYLGFDVVATAGDSAEIRTKLTDVIPEWNETTNDSLFVAGFGGTYTNASYDRGSTVIAENIKGQLFDVMEPGAIYGPYVEGNAYKLVKLVDREILADSANTRHILIPANTPQQFDDATAKIDSLKQVIQSGGNFAALAEEFSTDQGSKDNGGLYEGVTPGQFVKPYDDVIFRTGNLRELYSVRTTYGVHLVQVLSRSTTSSPRVKVAYILEPIVPSPETEISVLEQAQAFLNDHNTVSELSSGSADRADLSVRESNPFTINSFQMPELGRDGNEVRDIICWAFSADPGDVSDRVYTFTDPQLYYENKHVIVGVSSVIPAGLLPVDAVRDDLTPVVANQLKGAQIAGQLDGKSLEAIAQEFNVELDTLSNVNLTLTSLPGGFGREPKVIAAAFSTEAQQLSTPVIGETGVYIVKPLSTVNTTASGSLPTARQLLQTTSRTQVNGQLLGAMRSNLDLDDRRANLDCR